MPSLTIYTPTYNRGHMLFRVYESLKNQTSKDFQWLIIDDGSMDDTKQLIEKWKSCNNGFSIIYCYKKNEGVHTARNVAFRLCDTELIAGVDSDDWLVADAIEKLLKTWRNRPKGDYAGVIGRNIRPDGTEVLTNFPKGVKQATFQEFVYKYKCFGDKYTMLRSDIMKEVDEAPVYKGEKLVGETYRWIQISDQIPFILCNEVIGVKDYRQDGYSSASYKNVFNNPNGFRAEYEKYMINGKYVIAKIRGYTGYIATSFIIHDHAFIKHSPKKAQTVIMLPIGVLWYLYINLRKIKRDRKYETNKKRR